MLIRMGILVLAACLAKAGEFSGVWILNLSRSAHSPQTGPVPATLKIDQEGNTVVCMATGTPGAAPVATTYTTDGKESKSVAGGITRSSIVKWEGTSLLVHTIVREERGQYVVMERWRTSRDGTSLTIRRQVQRNGGESESTLVYEREGARQAVMAAPPESPQPVVAERQTAPRRLAARPADPKPAKEEYIIAAGTRVPLRLRGSLTSKSAQVGDKVYLETVYPVLSEGRLIIPVGTEVAGVVSHVKRPGRRSGRGELALHFETLIMANGVTRDLRAPIGGMDGNARGELDRDEGIVKSEGGKGRDARTIGKTTAGGASAGSVAGAATGHWGTGVGIGAAGGAAAGAIGTMMQRGPEAVLRQGTILEMVLDRTLSFKVAELVY